MYQKGTTAPSVQERLLVEPRTRSDHGFIRATVQSSSVSETENYCKVFQAHQGLEQSPPSPASEATESIALAPIPAPEATEWIHQPLEDYLMDHARRCGSRILYPDGKFHCWRESRGCEWQTLFSGNATRHEVYTCKKRDNGERRIARELTRCRFCMKSYGRPDTLKKHMQICPEAPEAPEAVCTSVEAFSLSDGLHSWRY
jgi:hypothetical protein